MLLVFTVNLRKIFGNIKNYVETIMWIYDKNTEILWWFYDILTVKNCYVTPWKITPSMTTQICVVFLMIKLRKSNFIGIFASR